MSYDATNDPYIDVSTGVLRNKLGATTKQQLEDAEAEITYVIIATIQLPKAYTLHHFTYQLFLQLHKEIFEPIYDWAGEVRTIDISKGTSYFAHTAYIDSELCRIFTELTNDKRLKSSEKDIFVQAVTYYHAEINAIHPFREGNGRSTRTFFSLLATNRGWHIDWSELDITKNIEAAIEAFSSEPKLLFDIILKRTSEIASQ